MMSWRKKILIIALMLILAVRIGGIAMEIRQREGVASVGSAFTTQGEYPTAPEFSGLAGWINSGPLSMEELRGKVVLLDFWTYSCINCIRTLPYLKMWYEKYSDDGFVIIGVHTPEFFFEEKYDNVKAAVDKYGIKYPVALDNEATVWRAYNTRYWPTKYLVDAEGRIRYSHIGEGAYEDTEKVIVELLREAGVGSGEVEGASDSSPEGAVDVQFFRIGTPEIYFGYAFAGGRNNLGNKEGFEPEGIVDYALPERPSRNLVYLGGKWLNKPDHMEYVGDKGSGKVVLRYSAKAVNVVAGATMPVEIKVRLDGMPLTEKNKGSDIRLGDGASSVVEESRLYNIVFAEDYGEHTVEIEVERGFRVYTFTFG